MKRSHVLLSVLAVVLVVAVFTMFLYQPKREELAEVQASIQTERDQQAQLQAEIARLREVRDDAPRVEAELAAAQAVVPRDASLPAALRQLQVAADDAGAVLESVTTSRPTPLDEVAAADLAAITVDVQITGSYFQLIDFLRRVEDPAISPRGVRWTNANIVKDEYPVLTTTVTGLVFVTLPAAPLPAPEGAPVDGTAGAGGEPTAENGDVEVDGADVVDAEVEADTGGGDDGVAPDTGSDAPVDVPGDAPVDAPGDAPVDAATTAADGAAEEDLT